jgi:ABC-type multidrug transport system fused ATPase/permease subunit
MLAQALMPFAIGAAIQRGIAEHDNQALAKWTLVLLGLGLVQAVAGVMRHRFAVTNWVKASFRMAQIVGHHIARTGPAIARPLDRRGRRDDLERRDARRRRVRHHGRLSGAVVAYIAVAIVLLSSSVVLGVIVLVGVPILVLLLGTVIKPLQARQGAQRHEVGALTALGADTAAGLRVLRGIGGEQAFFDRYRRQSQDVRRAGVRVATPQSTLDAMQVFIPGLFVVLVTWIGARFALSGEIGTGELVAFYGYAAFLVIPLRTAAEAVDKMTRSFVGAKRMLDVLAIEPDVHDPATPVEEPPAGVELSDPQSGLVVEPGTLTALVLVRAARDGRARRPHRAVRRGRRGARRCAPGRPARRGGAPPHRRQRGGPRALLGPAARGARPVGQRRRRRRRGRDQGGERRRRRRRACRTGLDEVIDERGRSFSGGQRQRLALTRALLADTGDPRARRADERCRRAHRGADRPAAARRARRPDHRHRHPRARSSSTAPTGSCSSRTDA